MSNQLLASLPEAVRRDVSHWASEVTLQPHSIQPLPTDSVFFPLTGLGGLFATTTDGLALEMSLVGREGAYGLLSNGVRALALEERVYVRTRAVRVLAEGFHQVTASSRVARDVIQQYQESVLAAVGVVAVCSRHHPGSGRLARWLADAHTRTGEASIPVTQESIGLALGLRRPTISVLMAELRDAGAISTIRGAIQIEDLALLESLSCDCLHTLRNLAELCTKRLRPIGAAAS